MQDRVKEDQIRIMVGKCRTDFGGPTEVAGKWRTGKLRTKISESAGGWY